MATKAKKKPVRRTAKATRKAAATGSWSLPARQQPETLRLRAATPGFTVNDIERSLGWYRDVLGCRVKERWERDGRLRGVEMQAGSVSWYLSQDDWQKGRDRRKGEGFRIYCTTAQDIDSLAAAIKARGGILEHEPQDQPWGGRDFAIVDPDGFKITIATEA